VLLTQSVHVYSYDGRSDVNVFRLTRKKVIPLNPSLKLLKAKRTSALVDARKMEAQLARLDRDAEATGTATDLRCIVGMFRDYSATLDEDIKLAHALRHRKIHRLSA
jgi:hypothetical protein